MRALMVKLPHIKKMPSPRIYLWLIVLQSLIHYLKVYKSVAVSGISPLIRHIQDSVISLRFLSNLKQMTN